MSPFCIGDKPHPNPMAKIQSNLEPAPAGRAFFRVHNDDPPSSPVPPTAQARLLRPFLPCAAIGQLACRLRRNVLLRVLCVSAFSSPHRTSLPIPIQSPASFLPRNHAPPLRPTLPSPLRRPAFLHHFCTISASLFAPCFSQPFPYQPLPISSSTLGAILLRIITHCKQGGFLECPKLGSHFHGPPAHQPQGARSRRISDFGLRISFGFRPSDFGLLAPGLWTVDCGPRPPAPPAPRFRRRSFVRAGAEAVLPARNFQRRVWMRLLFGKGPGKVRPQIAIHET